MRSNSAAMLPTAPRQRVVAWVPLSYALVALVALLPRELDLGAYVNIDEAMQLFDRGFKASGAP